MMGGRLPQGAGEVGQVVAAFPTYEAAQKAVSTLIAADVPARDIAIVGRGLRSIERVTGRLGYASAARTGAINGILLGLLFAAILVLGTPTVPIQAFVGVLFVGVAIGMLMSIVTFALVRRRRDFASVMQVVADSYEVSVAAGSYHRAVQVLGPQAAHVTPEAAPAVRRTQVVRPEPESSDHEPPRYGERIPAAGSSAPSPTEPADEPSADAVPASPDADGDASDADGDAPDADASSDPGRS